MTAEEIASAFIGVCNECGCEPSMEIFEKLFIPIIMKVADIEAKGEEEAI